MIEKQSIKNGQEVLNIGVDELQKTDLETLYKYQDTVRTVADWQNTDSSAMNILSRIIDEKKRQTSAEHLNSLCKLCNDTSVKHGFWAVTVDGGIKRNILEALALVHSEVSEAVEAYRVSEPLHEELADIVIRVFDLCGGLKIDLDRAVREKMKYNERRDYKHGKKC